MTTIQYKTIDELVRVHPELKSRRLVYHAPRGQSVEVQQAALEAKKITGTVYKVGDFFWQQAETTERICACLHYIHDNPHCPRHGKP